MLGVAFFTGLKLTRPAMTATAQAYLEETKMYDLRVLSTLGFDDDDVSAAQEIDGVTAAVGSIQTDALFLVQEEQQVLSTHMLTTDVNQAELLSGRMPEAADEVLADAEVFDESSLGEKISLSDQNDTDTLDMFAYTEYTIVGLVRTPLYLTGDRGTTSLGSGTVYSYLLLNKDGYDTEYYTELYLKMDEYELYSDAYEDALDELKEQADTVMTASVQLRYDTLVADAQAEIADGEKELEEQRTDAWEELEDARIQLADAEEELKTGEAELTDAKAELDDAKEKLDEAAEELMPGFSSWEEALNAGLDSVAAGQAELDQSIAAAAATLNEKQAELDSGEQAYTEGYAEWENGQAEYEAGLAEWQSGWDQYEAGLAEWQAGQDQYEAALAEWQRGWNQYTAAADALTNTEEGASTAADALPDSETGASTDIETDASTAADASLQDTETASAAAAEAELEAQRTALTAAKSELDAQGAALTSAKTELDTQGEALTAAKEELDASAAKLAAAKTQLDETRTTLDEGKKSIQDGWAQLETQRVSGQETLDTAAAQLAEFQNGIADYRDGYAEYEEAVQKISDGWKEYEDGRTEYEEGLEEFNTEIADAEAELADAKEELADLEEPKLYFLSREESNTGYASFDSDSMIVDNLSSVFPVFFFLIAALVCSTTMTRMIDDDRTEIGTLRALGYSQRSILAKYLIYSGSAALIGCLAGYFGGGYLFPKVIWVAYQMQYKVPGYQYEYSPSLFFLSLAASLVCSAGVTLLTCQHAMRSTPADLIRPLAPAAGKRILLEKITPLWRRLPFLHKVSLRNIFRFKKRMFMMLVGIAGCTALVLTGFGVWDSVGDIGNYQYDDIEKYDIMVNLDEEVSDEWIDEMQTKMGDQITDYAVVSVGSGDVTGKTATQTVYFMATDDASFTQMIDLHLDGEEIAIPESGKVILTDSLASNIGVSVGNSVSLSVSDTERGTAVTAAVTENYVNNYVYMNGTTYEQVLGKEFEPKTLLIALSEEADDYAAGAELSGLDHVSSVTVVADTRGTIDEMMESLNYVVLLILVCAAALAFIVLFNLGNINISERIREIATIRVLGFHLGEAGSYVFRENLILTCMGIICGLPLGVALHAFAMSKITVKAVSFRTVIVPMSYLWTILLVLIFSIATDLVLRRKIRKIDMAQALKSAE